MRGVKKEEEMEEEDLFFGSEGEDEESSLSSSEGEVEQQHAAATKRRSVAKPKMLLRFGDVLSPPTPVRYSCEALSIMIEKEQVDLEPEYQRGVVWSSAKQSAVIDSIFRNCYVPPILFSIHSQTNEEGDTEELRICVDGKQRLSSIFAFMHGEIPLREPQSGRAFWYKPGKSRKLALTQKQRDRFAQIQINCVEYRDLNEELERDMFQRVQMGVTLTPAEKLAANLGVWPDFFRELNKRFVENDTMNLRHVIKMDRGKDFMYMGMIALLILHNAEKSFVPHSNTLAGFLKKDPSPPAQTQRKEIIAALARLTTLANDDENNTPLLPIRLPGRPAKSIAPIEYLFAAYLCFRFPQANNAQLSQLIDGMMKRARSEHSDLMLNIRVERTIRGYIHEMEALHPFWMAGGKGDGLASPPSKGRKRQRGDESIDEQEWVPTLDLPSARSRADYLP